MRQASKSQPEAAPPAVPPVRSRFGRGIFATLKFRVVLVAVVSALVSGGVSTYFMSHESERVATMMFTQQQSDEVVHQQNRGR